MTASKKIRVFFHLHIMNGGRCRAQWIARGTGTVMYQSKVCASEHDAGMLAVLWLKKQTHVVDTSNGTSERPTIRALAAVFDKLHPEGFP